MRYVYMALIAAFAAIVILFKFQNLESVTVSLFSASVSMPVGCWCASSTCSACSLAGSCWR